MKFNLPTMLRVEHTMRLRSLQPGQQLCEAVHRGATHSTEAKLQYISLSPCVSNLSHTRGGQVISVNNPISGLLITASLFLQKPCWAVNGLLGTLFSTVSAILLRQNRSESAMSAGLYGYNGTLVGILMSAFTADMGQVFSSAQSRTHFLLFPALSSVANKWDLQIFTLPFNILVCLHIPCTHAVIGSWAWSLFLSVPVGVGQVYGCDSPWTGGLILLALLLSSPTICFQTMLGSASGMLSGLALGAPHRDINSGPWGYSSALDCIAVGGVFYVISWQTHLLVPICALFCAYMTSAIANLMSMLALPACSWPFCLSTLIFLFISSEIQEDVTLMVPKNTRFF
uniref:Urea transporter n=1 Tax=Monopterus albus TaxID=43700 RepID=A0A3Q3ILP6_MONAL